MTRVLAAFPDRRTAARAAVHLRRRWPVELYGATPTGTARGWPHLSRRVGRWAAIGAVIGAGIALAVQWWSATHAYPLLIGGRRAPTFASYLPPALAIAMFWSALGAFSAFLREAGLPRLHHPLLDSVLTARLEEGDTVVVLDAGDAADAAEAEARRLGATATDRVPE